MRSSVEQKEKYKLPLPTPADVMKFNEQAVHQVCLDHIVKTELSNTIQQGCYKPFVREADKILRKSKGKVAELKIEACIEKWSDPKGKYKMDEKILKILLKEIKLLNSKEAE